MAELKSVSELKASIVRSVEELERLFGDLSDSDRRLKPLPALPLPSLSIPYEYAALQTLRALELADAARGLIEAENRVAVFPVLRSLFETWMAVDYATIRFSKLVLEGEKWQRFDHIGRRLLRGRSDADTTDRDAQIIRIGDIIGGVKGAVGEKDAQVIDQIYDDLSDWTHPTIWSAVFHMESREDGFGTYLSRDPAHDDFSGPLFDLDLFLARFLVAVKRLLEVANDISAAFKEGPAKDTRDHEAIKTLLRKVLESPPDLPATQVAVLTERAKALLESYEGEEGANGG